MTETIPAPSGTGTVLLDIGADTGALILHAPAELNGVEIEISPNGVRGCAAYPLPRARAPGRHWRQARRRLPSGAVGDVYGVAGRGHPGRDRHHRRGQRHQLPVAGLSTRWPSQPDMVTPRCIAGFHLRAFRGQRAFGSILSGRGPSVVADCDGSG